MRIGVDMDGVLADFDKGWIDRYNAEFGADVQYKQCDHWDALVAITHFKDDDEWWEWATSKHEDLFLGLDPLPGAIEGMQQLVDDGHEIVIITHKPRWAAGHPSSWLREHGIHYDELHVTKKKHLVQADVYIDDALHNCEQLLAETDALVIQYSAWPYVNGGQRVDGAVYCTNWHDVVSAVQNYETSVRQTQEDIRSRLDLMLERCARDFPVLTPDQARAFLGES